MGQLDIGELIRNLRKERGISQKQLAEISKVSIAVISRIENCDLKVNATSLNNVLAVFGYSLGAIRPIKNLSTDKSNELD